MSRTRKPHKSSPTPRKRRPDSPIQASPRYTPPAPRAFRFRPGWHKAVGVLVIVAGAALFFTCQFNGWGIHDYGGHVWYLAGIMIAGSSLWWFGAFDPAT